MAADKLTSISTIKSLLARHHFSFSRQYGQNFIVNPGICPKIVAEGGVTPASGVLEIGPGIGVLTRELAATAQKVVAVEIDARLLPLLEETLADCANVKVLHGDVLALDLPELLRTEFPAMDVVICANLPYYITSPILMKLLEEKLPVSSITVMVQKEAATRLCAPLGTRDCGAISAAVWYHSTPKKLFDVSRGSFMPAPNVDSAVIRLNVRPTPPVTLVDEPFFFAVIKAAFAQRRKTLLNCLSDGLAISKDVLRPLLSAVDIAPAARAEQLTLEQFAALANHIHESTT